MSKITTTKIKETTLEKLQKIKEHKRETNEEAILRLILSHNDNQGRWLKMEAIKVNKETIELRKWAAVMILALVIVVTGAFLKITGLL